MAELCPKSTKSLTIATTLYAKSMSIPYLYTWNCNPKYNAHKSNCKLNWNMPNQQILQYEQSYNWDAKVTVVLIRPTVLEPVQFRIPLF